MANTQKGKSPFAQLHHISIVVRDIDAAVKFYESIGIGPFKSYPPIKEYVKIDVPDKEGFYNLTIQCAQIGPVELQLIQPGAGRSLYKDFLEKKGEGVYHLGFVVEDIEKSDAEVKAMGLAVISSGRRANGSGFSYLDTVDKAGVTLLIRQSPPGN
ncbi:MAG: VOC family protein [Desulfobacterales bacterium]|nr:MAG: VOC family protein [Desulfobacterales bacterium]